MAARRCALVGGINRTSSAGVIIGSRSSPCRVVVSADDENVPLAPLALNNHVPVCASRDVERVVLNLVTGVSETLLNIKPCLLQARIPSGIALSYRSCEPLDMRSQVSWQILPTHGLYLNPLCLRIRGLAGDFSISRKERLEDKEEVQE